MHALCTDVDDDLCLRPLDLGYANALFNLVNRDRAYLREFQNWPDKISSVYHMRRLIENSQEKARHNDGFDSVILYQGRPAGKIGLVFIDWRRGFTEVGYWIGAAFQGHGLVTRACQAITEHAINDLGLNQVHIRMAGGNLRSRAIPERLGYEYRGPMPHKVNIHGELHDDVLYRMTAHRWNNRMIYHITSASAWKNAQTQGVYEAPSLAAQGFIHLSESVEQTLRVANAIYTGQTGLVVLRVDPARLRAELRREPPDTSIPARHYQGELFPHLYGPLNLDAVVGVIAFPPGPDGAFTWPGS